MYESQFVIHFVGDLVQAKRRDVKKNSGRWFGMITINLSQMFEIHVGNVKSENERKWKFIWLIKTASGLFYQIVFFLNALERITSTSNFTNNCGDLSLKRFVNSKRELKNNLPQVSTLERDGDLRISDRWSLNIFYP